MALNGNDLGVAIKNAIVTEFSIAPVNQTDLTRWANATGNAIVDYIKANAELDTAKLNSKTVTGTTDATSANTAEPLQNGQVVDDSVIGGIK